VHSWLYESVLLTFWGNPRIEHREFTSQLAYAPTQRANVRGTAPLAERDALSVEGELGIGIVNPSTYLDFARYKSLRVESERRCPACPELCRREPCRREPCRRRCPELVEGEPVEGSRGLNNCEILVVRPSWSLLIPNLKAWQLI
jgi:hypothetical protein